MTAFKKCFRCKRVLPVFDFYVHRPSNGLQAYCRSCHVEDFREYRYENPDYNKTEHRKFNACHPGYNKMAARRARAEARRATQAVINQKER
jgi:hypothetical protein